jgi:hypothetical protein
LPSGISVAFFSEVQGFRSDAGWCSLPGGRQFIVLAQVPITIIIFEASCGGKGPDETLSPLVNAWRKPKSPA